MPAQYTLRFQMVAEARTPAPTGAAAEEGSTALAAPVLDAPWIVDDADVAASEAQRARNAARSERLLAALPGLAAVRPDYGLVERFVAEDGLDEAAALRRLRRLVLLRGSWGERALEIDLVDAAAWVQIGLDGLLNKADRADFAHQLEALIATLMDATGLQPAIGGEVLTDAEAAVTRLLLHNAQAFSELERHNRSARREARFGWLGFAVLTLAALAASYAIVAESLQRSALAARVDADHVLTFETRSLPPPKSLFNSGLFADYALDGRVLETGEQTRLAVYRGEFIMAGPGARFPVLATGAAVQPYLLRNTYKNSLPLLRLGPVTANWLLLLALLPLGLWLWFVARPVWRAPAGQRIDAMAMTLPMLRLLGKVALVLIVIAAIRVWL
ncbi:MAG: hypothetical protein KDJ24_13265 [Gammaproteobacteria bacterium]|nr:hypothetical protein [Gammaproteobacteria bacterium]